MCRRPETVQAKPLCLASHAQRAISDQPGTQQWRCLGVAVSIRHRKAEALIGQGEFTIAAVDLITGKSRLRAQVLAARSAERALATGPAEPGHADTIAYGKALHPRPHRRDGADDFVPGDQRQLGLRQVGIDNMEIRPANRTGMHPDQYLIDTR